MNVMDKEQRIQHILSEYGEQSVLSNTSKVYPYLEAPDPNSGRFKKLYTIPLKWRADWQGVPDSGIEFDRSVGRWNFGDDVVVRVPEKTLGVLPDITRITSGLLCAESAYRAIVSIDPEGVVEQCIKVISKSGETAKYFAVFAKRNIDPVNWAQSSVTMKHIAPLKIWILNDVKSGGIREDVPKSVHIIGGGYHYFSDELIESMRISGVRGVEFVNVVTLSSAVEL